MSAEPASSRNRATILGLIAILLWATLALLAAATNGIPPFETLSLSFAIACASGLAVVAARGRLALLRQPVRAWALGFAGLFFYHGLYFTAIDNAPPAQASLICYLWPLLIVLFAVLLPGGKLRPRHLVGALLGLTGTALILLGRGGALSGAGSPLGYASAFAAAFVWSGYSVTNRRVSAVPSDVIAGICGLVAIAGAITHFAVERTIVPDVVQALAIIGLGLGPVGLAFFVWDAATKHGDIALLGTLSYGAPLFSTLLLIAAGMAPASVTILGAAALIVGGAAISVGFSRRKADRRPSRQPAARPDGHAPPRGMR